MKPPSLPATYYLDHCLELLSFVEKTYGAVLDAEHSTFMAAFRSMPKAEQCLLVRMLNRRGRIFQPERFAYPEIDDCSAALEGLRRKGFVRALSASDYGAWLAVFDKAQLAALVTAGSKVQARRSWPKAQLLQLALTEVEFATAFSALDGGAFVVLTGVEPLEFLLYLYFGTLEPGLKRLALRDLGLVRVNGADAFSARFASAEEAKACFACAKLLAAVKASEISHEEAAARLFTIPSASHTVTALRDEAVLHIGALFEKEGFATRAVEVYRSSLAGRERLIRLLWTMGEKAEAQTLLEQVIEDPGSEAEHAFALDFYARKVGGRRTSAATELLRSAEGIAVDDVYRGAPEAGVAQTLGREGWSVRGAENGLWHSLFGLLFWDELYDSGHLASGFDWLPACLTSKGFAGVFADALAAKLAKLRAGTALPVLLQTVARRHGTPNALVAWSLLDIEALGALTSKAYGPATALIVEAMANDFDAMRDGFPDLLAVRQGELRLIEVKAEGDSIRRNQLTRLRQLQTAGFDAGIVTVAYRYDPGLTYVVVDVETTGGWGGAERLTELAAVKVVNGETISEWHTLLNPGRRIPARIVELTGITDAMVKDAPVFADVADSFLTFLGDGVFAAHNAAFDHGRIADEFQRLDRRFRCPKLCTKVAMRRHFPGHDSYSLKHLCTAYDIPLPTHHRALCDASAAAGLLKLINRERSARACGGLGSTELH
jgi:DNA polymerase-3 subunit epsilon